MGYTHYWRRSKELPEHIFVRVVADFKKVVEEIEKNGVILYGGLGVGEPEINNDCIRFNGNSECNHAQRPLGITWPADVAGGVNVKDGDSGQNWFAGRLLNNRTCGGDCSHETFSLPRIYEPADWEKEFAEEYAKDDPYGRYFAFCKTAYKPYDLAVTCCLIIAQHYLDGYIKITSDGTAEQWFDSKQLCQMVLGYGLEFKLLNE